MLEKTGIVENVKKFLGRTQVIITRPKKYSHKGKVYEATKEVVVVGKMIPPEVEKQNETWKTHKPSGSTSYGRIPEWVIENDETKCLVIECDDDLKPLFGDFVAIFFKPKHNGGA